MAEEDIEVYSNHMRNLELRLFTFKDRIEKAGRRPMLSEAAKIQDLEDAIDEYQGDIDRLNDKIREVKG